MPPITPDKSVGYQTLTRVIVICPICKQKRWANFCRGWKQARTTCCAALVDIGRTSDA